MKSFIKEKLNKIFLAMIIFILSICNFVYAEDEIPVSVDVYKSFEGWYKNWIMDFGAVRVTVRDSEGMLIEGLDFTVFPKQWEGKTEQKRSLNVKGADNQKDSKGREIFFMQKADGVIEFLNYINKDENGTVKYSDNIPQLAKTMDAKGDTPVYVYFNPFSDFLTIDDWKNYNNGENVNKLANDLEITCHQASGLSFYDWCVQGNGSIELQPLCLHPETTEQIYCNDLDTVTEIGRFQWNSDWGDYLKALNAELKNGEETEDENLSWWAKVTGFISDVVDIVADAAKGAVKGIKAFIDLKLLAGKSVFGFFGNKIVYEDYGVIAYKQIVSDIVYEDMSFRNRPFSFTLNIFEPKYILKTYTSGKNYSIPWNTDGWFNKNKEDVSTYYTKEEMKKMWLEDLYEENTDAFANSSGLQYRGERWDFDAGIENGTLNEDNLWYYVDFESWVKLHGFEEYEDGYRRPKSEGLGEGLTIPEDHNKYTTIISGEGPYLQKLTTNYSSNKFDTSTLPKYGAGIICGDAGGQQVLIKFHSNLEQIGGSGEIDEIFIENYTKILIFYC